jgi:hypothetical protein
MAGGMLIATVVFFGSILGIVLLFGIKYWELRTQRVIATATRAAADEQALRFKALLLRSRIELSKLPPNMVYIGRLLLREIALGAAGLSRASERQAHRIADMVSHKHRFERREPRSDFLKQMNEHKNGGAGLGENENS